MVVYRFFGIIILCLAFASTVLSNYNSNAEFSKSEVNKFCHKISVDDSTEQNSSDTITISGNAYPLLTCTDLNFTNATKEVFTDIRGILISAGRITDIRLQDLARFSNLETLSFINNSFLDVTPTSNATLTSVTALHISESPLNSVPVALLNRLPNLRYLSLTSNNIALIAGDEFSNLTLLKTLYLSGNQILSMNLSFLARRPNIKILGLRNVGLDVIPSGLKKAKFLTELDLSDNNITILPFKGFRQASQLETLNVANNRIQNISAKAFKGTYNLKRIDLTNNNISTLPHFLFNLLPLENVALWQNPMICDCKIAWLQSWITERINSGTQPNVEFECYDPVRNETLKSNEQSFKDFDLFCTSQDYTGVDNHFPMKMENSPSQILCHSRCSCYERRSQFRMQNTRVMPSVYYPLSLCDGILDRKIPNNLRSDSKTIVMVNGGMTSFGVDDVGQFKDLSTIVLSGNKISTLHSSSSILPVVTQLCLDSNKITAISKNFLKSFPNLVKLRLYNNQIRQFDAELFHYTRALKKLFLGPNLIKSLFPGDCLNDLDLTVVGLRGLNIKTVPESLKKMTNLLRLDLGENSISKLSSDDFAQNVHLQDLSLDANNISTIETSTFSRMTQLLSLDLSENALTSLPEGFMINYTSPPFRGEFWQNPLRCDCHLRWFREWTIQRELHFPSTRIQYQCDAPASMKGKTSDKTRPTEYQCETLDTTTVDGHGMGIEPISNDLPCYSTGQVLLAVLITFAFSGVVFFIFSRYILKAVKRRLDKSKRKSKNRTDVRLELYGKIPSRSILDDGERDRDQFFY